MKKKQKIRSSVLIAKVLETPRENPRQSARIRGKVCPAFRLIANCYLLIAYLPYAFISFLRRIASRSARVSLGR